MFRDNTIASRRRNTQACCGLTLSAVDGGDPSGVTSLVAAISLTAERNPTAHERGRVYNHERLSIPALDSAQPEEGVE